MAGEQVRSINEACKQSTGKYINIPTPEDLTLKYIKTGPACETHRLNNCLDILLKPLPKYIKSNIINDIDMLLHLTKLINGEVVLVCFDVIKFYSNIQSNYGIWLEK